MIRTLRAALLASLFAVSTPFVAQAVQPDEVLPDPKLESRARDLSTGLRCLVCQNQNIDDSDAPLAKDLRLLVRERLKQGDTDDQVRAYLQNRFGDFVLLKPPFKLDTLVLWVTPALVLIVSLAFVAMRTRTKKSLEVAGLSDAERAALESLAAKEKDA